MIVSNIEYFGSVFIPTTAHSIGQHFRVISAVRTKHGQGACCKMGDPSRVLISQEDADGTYITRNDGSMIELETALRGILHIREDSLEGVQNHASILDSDDKVYPVLNVHQKSDYGTKTHGNLTKSATFPSSGKTLSYALNGASLLGRSSQIYDNPSCVRSSSMPVSISYLLPLVLYISRSSTCLGQILSKQYIVFTDSSVQHLIISAWLKTKMMVR